MPARHNIFSTGKLDTLIVHPYGLTESEFTHILTNFPLVAQGMKDATLEAFRTVQEIK